jgi:RNA polymerase sigma factor (sigma-70 family)
MEPVENSMEPKQQTEEELLGEIRTLARGIAGRIVRSRDRADDIAQDVVLDCLASLRDGTWHVTARTLEAHVACLVMRRRVDMRLRRRRAATRDWRHLRELEATTYTWMEPDHEVEAEELAAIYKATLERLPLLTRRAFQMVREAGDSYTATAKALGTTPKAVAMHITKAHRVFRDELSERGYRVPQGRSSRPAAASVAPTETPSLSAAAEPLIAVAAESIVKPGRTPAERAFLDSLRRAIAIMRAELERRDVEERELAERYAKIREIEEREAKERDARAQARQNEAPERPIRSRPWRPSWVDDERGEAEAR